MEQDCRRTGVWLPCMILCIALATALVTPVRADDVGGIVLPDFRHIDLTMAHGGGTKYVKFDGGGQNALHFTTSTADPYGQVTASEEPKGSFYLSDTGGRGFFDDTILMVAVKGDIPDDFRIKIRASGYRWTPTPVLNVPPSADEVKHYKSSVDGIFTKQDLIYGPQSWKPCNRADYPIYYGQDMNDPAETFRFMYIDLKAGLLGQNSNLSGLVDQGMVKIEYEIENPGEFTVFNAYGWNNQSNQGRGISWTNDVAGESSSGPSGFSVRTKSQEPGGDVPQGTGSGGTGSVSYEEGQAESAAQEEEHSLSHYLTGVVNGSVVIATSQDPPLTIGQGEHASFTIDLPIHPGSEIGIARLFTYTTEGHDRLKGNGTAPDISVVLDGQKLVADTHYQDIQENGYFAGTSCINITGVLKDSGNHTITITNDGAQGSVSTVNGVLIVAVLREPDGSPVTYWIEEGCDAVNAAFRGSISGDENKTLVSFEGVHLADNPESILTIVSTGNSTRKVTLNSHEWEISSPGNLTAGIASVPVSPYLVEGLNSAGISIGSPNTGQNSLVNRNAILLVKGNLSGAITPQANISVRHIAGTNPPGTPALVTQATATPPITQTQATSAPTRTVTAVPERTPGAGLLAPFEEFFWSLFGIFSLFEGGSGPSEQGPPAPPVTVETVIPPKLNESPEQRSPPAGTPANFTVTLISDPPGAAVVFDGLPAVSSTPLTINDVQIGLHRVALTLEGYENLETVIEVQGDEEVTISLVPVTPEVPVRESGVVSPARSNMGAIYVDSVPSGAEILIDGRSTDADTPYIIPCVQVGSHRITLRKEKVNFPGSGNQVYVYADTISPTFITQEVVSSRTLIIDGEAYVGDEFSVNGRFPKHRVPAKVNVEGSS
ncbi:MAG: DUF3344 domain-containing protein, partial [Methanoregulaceae archaeon]|nr:DUF3344 domain-containing protein [Methanoregulaceae archaeon]